MCSEIYDIQTKPTSSNSFRKSRINRLSYEGHVEMVKEQKDFYTIVNSIVLCRFLCLLAIEPILWEDSARLYYISWERSKREI